MQQEPWAHHLKRPMRMPSQQRATFLTVVILTTISFTMLFLQISTNLSLTVVPMPCISPLKPQLPFHSPSRLLPHEHWEHRRLYPENYKQISCSNIPRLEDIHYSAASWQHLLVDNGSVHVFGAYWDGRFDEPLVRVLLYCDVTPLPTLMCQLWYEDENAPVTVPANVTYGWERGWGGPKDGINEPYILDCHVRHHPPAPAAVSLVREDFLCGTPTNVLKVQGAPRLAKPHPPLNTSTISVCLKWLHFHDDVSAELIEWIELIKAFGGNKLFVFVVQVHPNTRKVLDYYTKTGFVDMTEFAHPPQLRSFFPPAEQNFHDFRRELLPLNDCLYRSVQNFQWMTPVDSDEIIVPRRYNTWQEIIAHVTERIEGLDALVFRNYYFVDAAQRDLAAPPYLKILGHLWRAREPNPPGYNVKSFHNTSSVVAMHNHYPMSCGESRGCWSRDVNTTVARLHHYRDYYGINSEDFRAVHDTEKDYTMTKWKHLIQEVDRVLATLEIKPEVKPPAHVSRS